MLYSKLGSIPKLETDGTEGWIEVSDPPIASDGQEVVWWFPPGWVIRSVKPNATETTDFSWSQSQEQWMEYSTVPVEVTQTNTDIVEITQTNTDTI